MGKETQHGYESRVYLEDIDWFLMDEWNSIQDTLSNEIKIQTFVDVTEDLLDGFCKAYTEMENLVPKGEQDWESVITHESRREFEESQKATNTIWITKITQETDGSISGLIEVEYSLKSPFWASQELTPVTPKYRGRGLGKLLKANMAIHLQDTYPE